VTSWYFEPSSPLVTLLTKVSTPYLFSEREVIYGRLPRDANATPLYLYGRIVFFGGGGATELKRGKYKEMG